MLNLDDSTELCRLFGDPTRARLLAILREEELTVAELTEITRLSQSRVSTHLGKLREARLVRDRRAGASHYYSLNLNGMPKESRRLWTVLAEQTHDPLLEEDLGRLSDVVRAREQGRWADSVAGRMHRHYSPGRTWEAACRALLGLAQLGRVVDIASGDGVLAELVAPLTDTLTCVDLSERVIEAGRQRLAHLPNVRFVQGDMHALPLDPASFDAAALLNALTYARDPERVLRDTARVLVPGGRLVGSTLATHKHEDVVAQYDHVRLGFEPEELAELLARTGFEVVFCARTCRERRKPYFEIITFHARRTERGREK